MSQAHGRNSGSRENGPRQPSRPSKTAPRRDSKPFTKAQPARSTANAQTTASIFKTRSFKLLVDAAGAENIALGLDSNLTRVTELLNGVGFTPETAFHIETTLGLPDGFFDQPNPSLTPEMVTRLKSPLDFVQVNAENTPGEHLPKDAEMRKKNNGHAQAGELAEKPAMIPLPKKLHAPAKPGLQQSLPLTEDASVEKIRRANLHVLTSRNGSKARLSALMELSGSNMAHRLHGQKRLDDAEANRFTERLGLPIGWLDSARTAADIPASVTAMLLPSRRAGGIQDENKVRAQTVMSAAADEAPAQVPLGMDAPVQPVSSTTRIDHLQGIQPIAEALLKTLAGKARAGLLDEAKALEMLQQAVLL
ncbi:hypothetical protein ASG35_08760 [Burkholderia sp. Leaf177]|uniref:hypothetical protein n=1 Tax=Burkholderia sp. Leaf177 TaxID=1736287 RepID=UPI0006FC0279|nr:hypothetical protein [Burkholderia sp. Leaf177]KQR78511.1 hypothetical protein ASG35_08760 [Burkholderia sp. Leaf177]